MYDCLNCGYRWATRVTVPRQCPRCWGTSIVNEDVLQRAAIIARFFANWQMRGDPLEALKDVIIALFPEEPPSLPLPRFLPSLWAWNEVMALAKTREMKLRAISRMLELSGFSTEDARRVAERLV